MADPVFIESIDNLGIACLLVRNSATAKDLFGLPVVSAAGCSRDGPTTFLGLGPGHWLALQEKGGPDFTAALGKKLGDAAWVVDQSGAYRVFRIAGAKARTLLQRGVPVDLHPDAFGPDASASTVIAHMAVILWRLEETDAFAVAVFRSYESAFRHWLAQAAAAL